MRTHIFLTACALALLGAACGGGTNDSIIPGPAVLEPAIDVDPLALDLGSVQIGNTGDAPLTLTNLGTATLTITDLVLTDAAGGPASAEYGLVAGGPALPLDLGPGEQELVTLGFTPADEGQEDAILTIASNDPTRPMLQVPATAMGSAPPPDTVHEYTMLRMEGGPSARYTFNLTKNEYAWVNVIPGGATGSGTLTPAVGGNPLYVLSEDDSTVRLQPDGMAVIGSTTGHLTVGVPPRTTAYDPADIAGMYNLVGITRMLITGVQPGTVELTETGAFHLWGGGNGSTLGPGAASLSGTWTDRGDGVLVLLSPVDLPTWEGMHAVLYPDGDETVLVMAEIGFEYMWAGVRQRPHPAGADGFYDVHGTDITGVSGLTLTGTTVDWPTESDTVVLDAPWTGFAMSIDTSGSIEFNYFLFSELGALFGGSLIRAPGAPFDEGALWAGLR